MTKDSTKSGAAERKSGDPIGQIPSTKPIVPSVQIKCVSKNTTEYCSRADQIAAELFRRNVGACDPRFVEVIISELAGASRRGGDIDEGHLNLMLSVVTGLQPRDQIEALLLVQMASVHVAAMKSARYLADADTLQEVDSFQNAANKLMRTFLSQAEVFKRYRSDGEQKVTVQQNVSVLEGGQAIVGNVTQVPPAENTKTPALLTKSEMPPMPSVESGVRPVPAKRSEPK